jgi:hypothetical protein
MYMHESFEAVVFCCELHEVSMSTVMVEARSSSPFLVLVLVVLLLLQVG